MEISSCTPGCPANAVACEIPLQAKLRSPCPDRIALGLFEQLSTVVQHVCLATVDPLTRRIAILDGDTKIANTITKRTTRKSNTDPRYPYQDPSCVRGVMAQAVGGMPEDTTNACRLPCLLVFLNAKVGGELLPAHAGLY